MTETFGASRRIGQIIVSPEIVFLPKQNKVEHRRRSCGGHPSAIA